MAETKEIIRGVRKTLYRKAREIGIDETLFAIGFGILALYIPLIVHELSHIFMATLLGYKGSIGGLFMFEGWSSIALQNAHPFDIILIALAGPIGAFLFGKFMWEFGKNTPERYIGLVSWLISCLPNLIPIPDGRDITYVIKYLGYLPAWIIFISLFAYIWIKLLFEGVGPIRWEE